MVSKVKPLRIAFVVIVIAVPLWRMRRSICFSRIGGSWKMNLAINARALHANCPPDFLALTDYRRLQDFFTCEPVSASSIENCVRIWNRGDRLRLTSMGRY